MPGHVVEPFALPSVNPRHCQNIFGDLHATIDRHIVRLDTGGNPTQTSFRNFLLYLKGDIPAAQFAELQRKWLKPNSLDPDDQPMLKFFDVLFWFEGKNRIAQRLGLDRTIPTNIVDIGAGAAHFGYVARYFGHQVLGTDLEPAPGASRVLEMYADFRALFRTPWVSHRTTVTAPLPPLNRTFDLCTSFLTKFHEDANGVPWSVEDWEEYLRRLLSSLSPGRERIYLQLNEAAITAEVWDFLDKAADWSAAKSRQAVFGPRLRHILAAPA